MTYVLLDDNYPNNPKVEPLTIQAKYLYVCGLCYCNRNLTDGALTAKAVKKILLEADVRQKHVVELMDAGLWDRAADGFLVHDWGDVNHPAEVVKAKRKEVSEKRREAGRKGAEARWANGKRMAKQDGKAVATGNGPLLSSPLEDQEPLARSLGVVMDGARRAALTEAGAA